MKSGLEHLPETKRRELARVVEVLFSEFECAIAGGKAEFKRQGFTNLIGFDPIRDIHGLPLPPSIELIGYWLGLMDQRCTSVQYQFAACIDMNAVDACECELNCSGIAPSADFEIVFQALLVASKHQVDAGIDGAPADAAIKIVGRADVLAQEVVRLARNAVQRLQRCLRIRSRNGHPNLAAAQRQNRRAGGYLE